MQSRMGPGSQRSCGFASGHEKNDPSSRPKPDLNPLQVSSLEELTFVAGCLLRSVSAVLDVVRRMTASPTSSREHGSTVLKH
jgi:hypothetical protein